MTKFIYGMVAVVLVAGVLGVIYIRPAVAPVTVEEESDDQIVIDQEASEDEGVMCTMEAKICPDGSAVGRSGPDCEFTACPGREVASDVLDFIADKSDLIQVGTPEPGNSIASPLTIAGQARGTWFFEASFPVSLVDWNGLIIAEGFVTADNEWMTEEFVPFSGELEFTSPYTTEMDDFMKNGTLILQKANASGLPEHDDAVEIPVTFVANSE